MITMMYDIMTGTQKTLAVYVQYRRSILYEVPIII